MDAEGNNNNIRTYIYRGELGEVIPRDGNHTIVIVHKDVTIILASAFLGHRKILEVICHEGVEKIESYAFYFCTSLRRVVMPGVKVIEQFAFESCFALTDVECDKLETIKEGTFQQCKSLTSINLPSVEIAEGYALAHCEALTDVKFGSKLERFAGRAFLNCRSIERIAIPLKDGLITGDGIFMGCTNLKHVDLVEGELHETIDALLLDDWRNDMNEVIDSINQILPNSYAGLHHEYNDAHDDEGEKAQVIRRWIKSVLSKINHYQVEHQRLLDEAVSTTLQLALPHDIVMNNILSFLELPSHTFELEED